MPAPSLSHIARRALIKNISNGWELNDIADTRYDIIRPVLLKTANPTQLKLLEEASPQLYGADAEIWIALIKRDVPKAEEKMLYPKNPKSWWKVYDKMLKDHQKEAEAAAIKLKEAFKGIKEAKKPPPAIMEGVPHLPKLGGMKVAHLLEHNKCYAKKRKVQPVLNRQRYGTTSKKELTGTGVMAKVRREALEQSQKWKASPNPKDHIKNLVSQVPVAPRHMVEQYQKSQALNPSNSNTPKSTTPQFPSSTISDSDRPRMSAMELMDEQNRQHVLRRNQAKAASAGTSLPSTRPGKRTRAPPKEIMPSGPGHFNNVMYPNANKRRRLG
ncbi:MAG: hypothetical protein Q9168_000560 [Polycauliona sp. 1 TL-2023]